MRKFLSKHSTITDKASLPLLAAMTLLPLVAAMTTVSAQASGDAGYSNAKLQLQNAQPSANDVLIKNISFIGSQRTTAESLILLLPVTVGSIINEQLLADSIKSLYASGNFVKVDAKVIDNKLIFYVLERPTLASLTFEGNKLIPTEGLEQGLANAGLVEGKLLKQSTLFGVANEIQQQYLQQGYYNSDINVDQELMEGNRAKVHLEFVEGKPAKVVDINVVGNQYFNDDDIKSAFILKESNWGSSFKKSDRYAQDRLKASLEKVKELYYNAGFVRFSIDNQTINISEDKEKVYIELSVTEGQRYQFGDVNFLGEHKADALTLQKLVSFRAGERYSQTAMRKSVSGLQTFFGDKGYYFAKVRPVPQINDVTKTVDVNFYLDPGSPVYVRNINFEGNIKTKDTVLRRQMRQMEGALASASSMQLSRTRLMRTGYFKSVDVGVRPVESSADKIDIIVSVEEQATGSSNISAGYSQTGGVTFQLGLSQKNFMGTGNAVNLSASRSETRDAYSLGYTNPFFTKDGVSQSISGYYRETKSDDKNVSKYISDSIGASLRYGYPVDENIRLNAGLNIDNTDIVGGAWMGVSQVDEMLKDGAEVTVYKGDDAGRYNFAKDYMTYNLLLGWDYNDLDQPVFPTKGMSHSVDVKVGFGDKQYQKATYTGNIYQPLGKGFIARAHTKLGYGNELPFYENFYAGGAGSVRGYKPSSLGPKSTAFYDTTVDRNYMPDQVGGNAVATVGTELILPMPFKSDWATKIRPVLFVEGGQVFDTTDKDTTTFSYKNQETAIPLITQDEEMRYSYGIGSTWYTAIGPISISYAKPFNHQEGDDVDEVQFQIGSVF